MAAFSPLNKDSKTVNRRDEGKSVNLTEGDWVSALSGKMTSWR